MNASCPSGTQHTAHKTVLSARMLVAGPAGDRMSEVLACLKQLNIVVASPAETSSELLSRIPEEAPSLVFLDMDLPGAPVLEVAEEIHKTGAASVLFVGTPPELEQIPDSHLSFPFGYLAPPFHPGEMQRLIAMALHTADLKKKANADKQARQAAEARYDLLANHISDVIFTMDLELRYTYVSPSIKRMRGFDPEELIGKTILDMVTPESREELISRFEEQMEKERSGQNLAQSSGQGSGRFDPHRFQILEMEVFRKDGTTIWIESRVSFLRDENFQPVGLIGINRDITDKRQMIGQLQESEEKFRALAERCPFAIMIYQNDYWVYVNPAAEAISGYLREEFYRMRFWEVVHPDYQPMVRARGNKRQAGQAAPPAYDFKIVHKTGRAIWVSLSGSPLMYQGKPAGLITIIDIDERKRAEAAMMRSEARYRTILESIEDIYYEVDLKGNLTFFNDRLCRISGYSREEATGVNYRHFAEAESVERLRKFFYRISDTGTPSVPFAVAIILKDGTTRHMEITASLIKNQAGEPVGFRGIARDISERMLAEKHRQKLEIQLRHAQKMEAIGTLAGGIAHDFNNILQAISGYTQLLLLNRHPEHPDARKLVQIRQAGERAGRLIQQLLTFSRKMEGTPKLLCLNHEVRQAEELLRQTVPKMIAIELSLDEDLWGVNADPMHIEQILLNLGSNAADAMPEGGRLVIETANVTLDQKFCKNHVDAVPGGYVLLTVTDNGTGMDESIVTHIFDPFFTTKAVGKGTGMGLASVYGIVKNLGGIILCYSEPGRGSTFKIYLPAAGRKKAVPDARIPETAVRGGTESILVVDDEVLIRETAAEMLSHYGYTVLLAENGEAALEMFRHQMDDIHLIIMDISMPGMGGYQCMQEILKESPDAKVVIASGYATSDHAREASELGAAGFIGKPYRFDDIIATVRQLLDR